MVTLKEVTDVVVVVFVVVVMDVLLLSD